MNLIFLFIVSFFQNMAFTWVSRSRNSGDPKKHFVAATLSNSIWFLCNFFIIFPEILDTVSSGNTMNKFLVMIVYVLGTTLGSVTMMKINLGHWYIPFLTELDKSKVGER